MPTVTLDTARIAYHDLGARDANLTLLLIHAFPLEGQMWEEQVRHLTPAHRMIAPDLKGFGSSDAPAEPGEYSVESYADDMAGLISLLDVERAVLVGLGLGGRVALSLFRRHTEQVAGLALAGTDPRPPPSEDIEWYSGQQHWIEREREVQTLVPRLADRLVGAETTPRPHAMKWARQLLEATTPDGWAGGLQAVKQGPDFGSGLEGIDVPVTVIHGQADRIVPPSVAEETATRIPGAELVLIPNAGHLVNMEQPEAFNQALDALLARI